MRRALPVLHRRRSRAGFTVIELMAVMVVAAILLALAVPSWRDTMVRKRVEGVFVELQTDLEYARSEAVARNAPVRVSFGSGCYVVHLDGSTMTCNATTQTVTPPAAKLKGVSLGAGSTAAITPQDALSFIRFEPLRGVADHDSTGTQAVLVLADTSGAWPLRVSISGVGRVNVCSPAGAIKGYPPCP
jgi:prepilin-type N-terminal cleavage/methylation domain-containing protein